MANPNFDAILSTTLKNYIPRLEDNVFSARPFVFFLKQAGQIRTISGGAKIVIPLIHALNDTAGSYSQYDPLPTTPQDGISAAEFSWKEYAVSIAISGYEEAVNSGEEEIIDLLEAKTMQAEESILENWDEMFLGDGTGNGGKDFLGLEHLVGQNASAVGGINPSTDTFWQSNIHSSAEVLAISRMTNMYNTCAVGNDRPNVILTSQTLYEKYESLLQPALRYADTKTADAGFQNLMFKGAPVTYDDYNDADDMWFLNTKYLRLVGHKDVWFKPTPFVRPPNQNARYAQILCQGELTVSNRKRQGLLSGKTA